MTLTRCFDAAFPPETVPAGAGACLGYVGGRATHVWTLEEWRRFAGLRQFPAWVLAVEGETGGGPVTQADEAVAAVKTLGWNERRAIIGDMETSTDRAFWRAFETRVDELGYRAVAYGSQSTILQLDATRLWVALWNGQPTLPAGWRAHQYMSGGGLDWSVIGDLLLAQGGIGPRQ